MFSGVLSFSAHSLFSHALLCGKSSGGQMSTFQVTNITPPGKSASWLSTNGGRAAVRNRTGLAGQSWTSGRVAGDFSTGGSNQCPAREWRLTEEPEKRDAQSMKEWCHLLSIRVQPAGRSKPFAVEVSAEAQRCSVSMALQSLSVHLIPACHTDPTPPDYRTMISS